MTDRPRFRNYSKSELIQSVRLKNQEPHKIFQLSNNDMFQAVVLKSLAKEPGNHYPTVASLLAELEGIGKHSNMPTAGVEDRHLTMRKKGVQLGCIGRKRNQFRISVLYKLIEELGEGGMAEQERPVRRRVAFQLIKAGLDNMQILARFEAKT